jgi:hypothetical protein
VGWRAAEAVAGLGLLWLLLWLLLQGCYQTPWCAAAPIEPVAQATTQRRHMWCGTQSAGLLVLHQQQQQRTLSLLLTPAAYVRVMRRAFAVAINSSCCIAQFLQGKTTTTSLL